MDEGEMERARRDARVFRPQRRAAATRPARCGGPHFRSNRRRLAWALVDLRGPRLLAGAERGSRVSQVSSFALRGAGHRGRRAVSSVFPSVVTASEIVGRSTASPQSAHP